MSFLKGWSFEPFKKLPFLHFRIGKLLKFWNKKQWEAQ